MRIFALFISVICGLLIGCFENLKNYYAISRLFTFLPYFLFGFFIDLDLIVGKIKQYKNTCSTIFIIVLLAVPAFIYSGILPRKIFSGTQPYIGLNDGRIVLGIFQRFISYWLGSILSFSFFGSIGSNESIITRFGKNSIWIYAVHVLIIRRVFDCVSRLVSFGNEYVNTVVVGSITIIVITVITYLIKVSFLYIKNNIEKMFR